MRDMLEEELRRARPVPPAPRPAVVAQARFLATSALVETEKRRRKAVRWGPPAIPGRAIAVAAAALVCLSAAVAIAASSRDWWFFHTPAVQPLSQPVVVASSSAGQSRLARMSGRRWESGGNLSGTSAGMPWEFTAFTAKHDGGGRELCYGVTPNPPNPKGEGAALGCGPTVYPGPGHSDDPSYDTHWLARLVQIPGETETATVKFISGPTAPNVARVDLIVRDGRPISVPTIPAPKGLDLPLRFYVAVLPAHELIHTLVPRDANGNALEHWELPEAL